MASIKFILDKRTAKGDGTFPVKLSIVNNRTATTVSTGLSIPERFFANTDTCSVISPKFPNAKALNMKLSTLYASFLNTINRLEMDGTLDTMTAADIIRRRKAERAPARREVTVNEYMRAFTAQRAKERNRAIYTFALEKIERFAGNCIKFHDIGYKFLMDFDAQMSHTLSVNTVGMIMRCLRAVFNAAINEEVTDAKYPFRKYKIRTERKEKQSLTAEQVRRLYCLDGLQGRELWARDFFMLSFFFCGINPIDLYNLPKSTGFIAFVREKISSKNPDKIHIAIQPEAQAIIDRYSGAEHLLNFAEGRSCFETFRHNMAKALKRVGKMIGVPQISMYWARYSWATITGNEKAPRLYAHTGAGLGCHIRYRRQTKSTLHDSILSESGAVPLLSYVQWPVTACCGRSYNGSAVCGLSP